MRPLFPLLLALAALTPPMACAQAPNAEAQPQAASALAPGSAATLAYIHNAWSTLTRSAADCTAFADSKTGAAPLLYLPAGRPATAEVVAVQDRCSVKIAWLPRHIQKLDDVRPEELPAPGLLYLPNPYVVPGGRFNEMYGWDSYFILLGLEADHHEQVAKGMVDNFLFEIEHYGAVLNANRTYYLTRSQPPLLTSMIRAVYENPASFAASPAGRAEARAWLERAYALALKDYSNWTQPAHKAGTTGLTRYFDLGDGPVPEMADDSSYYSDVIRWLIDHPKESAGLLVKGAEHPDSAEAARLKLSSCDVRSSAVCSKAWAAGYRLSREFYQGDRAMRESGFDSSNRFGPFGGFTHHFAPVCLNSLLYRYERDLEHLAHLLGKPQDAEHWKNRAKARAIDMQRYLWRPKDQIFADFDFVHAKTSTYAYLTSLYPLWAGVATREQAAQIVAQLKLFERPGGLSMSTAASGLQWDEPYGWAPSTWLAVAGLEAFGYRQEARRIARAFCATVDAGFTRDGTIREKYNVADPNAAVQVTAGYKSNEIGFGWTNGVYLKMQEMLREPIDDTAK
jgi:alpha,alpha-trehalase